MPRGLYKLTGAANNLAAREDYQRLVNLARQIGRPELVTPANDLKGWRAIDEAAKGAVERLLQARPDLREVVRSIYPGLVEAALERT